GALDLVQVRPGLRQAGRRVADPDVPLLRGGAGAVRRGLDLLRRPRAGLLREDAGLLRRGRETGVPAARGRARRHAAPAVRDRLGAAAVPRAAAALQRIPRHLPLRDGAVLIDVHHHATTEALTARRDRAGLSAPPGMPAWTREIAVETMDSIGVTASVLSVPADLGWLPEHERGAAARDVNDELAGIVARAPQRFGAFATIPLPDPDAALAETGRALDDLGLDGVCVLTSYNGGYLTDERYAELLAEWNRRRVVVFVHPILLPGPVAGLSPALLEGTFDTTRFATKLAADRVLERYP